MMGPAATIYLDFTVTSHGSPLVEHKQISKSFPI